jgi:hypothetical protein
MKHQKAFVIPLSILIIAILIALGGYVYLQSNLPVVSDKPAEPVACTMDAKQCPDGSYVGRTGPNCEFVCPVVKDEKLIYKSKNFGLEFAYPKEIVITENTKEISLNHSIPFKNYGCDMKGDGISYDKLSDFGVSIKFYNKSLVDTAKLESSFLTSENFSGSKLVVSPGYIDSYKVGSFDGYSIYTGVEGCGYTNYYLPISNVKTLVVKRNQVQEFSGIVTPDVKEKVLAVPGVISKEKADLIFNQILTSIKFNQ